MKRMNEVFELPVDGWQIEYLMSETSGSDDDAIANAINNADSLADALEFLLSLPRGSSGRIIIEKSEETLALAALNAYRGVK